LRVEGPDCRTLATTTIWPTAYGRSPHSDGASVQCMARPAGSQVQLFTMAFHVPLSDSGLRSRLYACRLPTMVISVQRRSVCPWSTCLRHARTGSGLRQSSRIDVASCQDSVDLDADAGSNEMDAVAASVVKSERVPWRPRQGPLANPRRCFGD
jgi:hypothetical protein